MNSAQKCPELQASFVSRALFLWNDTLIEKGYERPLQAEDVWDVREDMSTVFCRAEFSKAVDDKLGEQCGRQQHLLRGFYHAYARDIWISGTCSAHQGLKFHPNPIPSNDLLRAVPSRARDRPADAAVTAATYPVISR